MGRELLSPGGGSIGEETALVRWQMLGKISFFGHLEERKGSGSLEGTVPCPQWGSGAGALGHRRSVVGVRDG